RRCGSTGRKGEPHSPQNFCFEAFCAWQAGHDTELTGRSFATGTTRSAPSCDWPLGETVMPFAFVGFSRIAHRRDARTGIVAFCPADRWSSPNPRNPSPPSRPAAGSDTAIGRRGTDFVVLGQALLTVKRDRGEARRASRRGIWGSSSLDEERERERS